jgi:hypothetical protein
MECLCQSLCLDAGLLDHLRPFVGFVDDEFAEFRRRHWRRHPANGGKSPDVFPNPVFYRLESGLVGSVTTPPRPISAPTARPRNTVYIAVPQFLF